MNLYFKYDLNGGIRVYFWIKNIERNWVFDFDIIKNIS